MVKAFEISHKYIPGLTIADPHYAFRGLTYGDWITVWWNNFFSSQPDNYYDPAGGIVFLRGSVEYAYEDDPDKRIYAGQTKDLGLTIPEGTAVFFPVITSLFVIEDKYQGIMMNNQLSIRSVARMDTVTGGDLWARIMMTDKAGKKDGKMYPLVDDLNDFLVESSFFTLLVDEDNPFKSKMDGPITAGIHYGVSVGIYILISNLQANSQYRLEFGGKGVGRYFTHSVYDINVTDAPRKLNDVSIDNTRSRMQPFSASRAFK